MPPADESQRCNATYTRLLLLAAVVVACADQSRTKNQLTGSVLSLDGTGSNDPDGDSLTYQWYGPFGTAQGPTVNRGGAWIQHAPGESSGSRPEQTCATG